MKGYYYNTNDYKCSACDSNCYECLGKGICDKCNDGYYLDSFNNGMLGLCIGCLS